MRTVAGTREGEGDLAARPARRAAVPAWVPWAAVSCAILVSLSLGVGAGGVAIPWGEVGHGILAGVRREPLAGMGAVIWQIRLPRAIAGLVTGAVLGLCGAAYQGLFQNPLADPYLMGTASGAAFGATVALTTGSLLGPAFAAGVAQQYPAYVPLAAFMGAVGAVLASVALARRAGSQRTSDLILAGVVVGSVMTAATTYLMLRDRDRIRAVFTWTLGNLALAGWPEVAAVLPYALAGSVPLLLSGRLLNALQLGEDVAATLGVPVEAAKLALVAAASLATAAVVAQVGIIGFVGLVVPHVARRLVGGDHRRLLPFSALAGAALLALADLVARTATRPAELPVGVVTALVGGPFFLYLLRRSQDGHA